MVSSKLATILNQLKGVKGKGNKYTALCPAHDDKRSSLSISEDNDKIILHCFAGCEPESICSALGLTLADLFLDAPKATETNKKIIAEYSYVDENGKELFQVIRYEPKGFSQRHRDNNGNWVFNLNRIRRVLYHLPEILAITDEPIYLVEGEKDADNMWGWARVATTSPGGANAWKPEYADYLKNQKVVVIPDKDIPGYTYARNVVRSLKGKAREVKVIILPGDAKDISDWLELGNHVDALDRLEQDASVLFQPDRVNYQQDDSGRIYWEKQLGSQPLCFQAEKLTEERTGIHGRITISMDTPLSWSYLNIERREDRSSLATAAHSGLADIVKDYSKDDLRRDLDLFCAGLWEYRTSLFVPEMLQGDERVAPLDFLLQPYLLSNGGTILYAPPGRGKSYTALLWAVSVDAGCNLFWHVMQTPTLFINLERSRESVRRRLSMVNKILGLPPTRPLFMLNARGKSLSDVTATCRKAIRDRGIGFIVLDSISRAGAGDLNENLSGNRVIDALSGLCPSWLALGHTPRASEGHLFGSVMQDAGADICVQLSSQTTDNGCLGIGWEVTKQNDTGKRGQEIMALEFGDMGLTRCRKAKPFEFPEIEAKGTQSLEQTIIDFVLNQEGADATATQIAKATGFNRANVSHYLAGSGKFVETRKGPKNSTFYGIKDTVHGTLMPGNSGSGI